MGFFFNKDRGKNKAKDQNAVQGALEDAGAALKGDPLQEAVRKNKNNR
ncbi:small acid-soluble spore protein SspJ [Bacillus sonorensis]|uniref:Small acid-soluble spore protein J n=2 Tax=Bacillus sonorensis TaxID=119858 RepID=M5P120_9BACI|nr:MULTISPECIES: small acid-soluble spore protein SspJ [Bacillus]TWK79418.1 Small, acid-soluble spore protein J [Bacillus paralicheniformis]ASB90754.1 Small, acid-soluble spore protein J [Bacillus sonorensis]EME73149.1 small acid-soluble spore protein J [Bacillus sonorensis L12]MBG9914152.1 spore protein [Bacillus sonorensis]MCF7616610.1 small acid-soluble spore protein SspJ [Bacillus sonorensis]